MTQPEALQLADDRPTSLSDDLYQWASDAEVELRRLHALNKELVAALKALNLYETMDGLERMATERAVSAALLKAEGYV